MVVAIAGVAAAPVRTPAFTKDWPSACPMPGKKYEAANPTMAGAFLDKPRVLSRPSSALPTDVSPLDNPSEESIPAKKSPTISLPFGVYVVRNWPEGEYRLTVPSGLTDSYASTNEEAGASTFGPPPPVVEMTGARV
jgi:hypothetical protein